MSVERAANFASSLIRDDVSFRQATWLASRRFGVEWRDIQQELTRRSAQMRAPRRPPPEEPPAPEEPTKPEAEQGKFPFVDETRRVIRNMLLETNGAGGGAGGAGGGAGGGGGAAGAGAGAGATGGTGTGTGGASGNGTADGGGGTNMHGGDGHPGSKTMKTIHLGLRGGFGYYPYYPRKKRCKHGRRKDGKCRKAPKESREVVRDMLRGLQD